MAAIVMTEPGQTLALPRDWVVTYFAHRYMFIVVTFAGLAGLWWLHYRYRLGHRWWMIAASAGVVVCTMLANFFLSTIFPTYQHRAEYVSVAVADRALTDEDVIYAVEINGETRGFPQEHMKIPHIAGATIGGKNVVMTFCALSNLPVVFDQTVGPNFADLRVLLQTHNNLIMSDRQSGEVIQQITGRAEFSDRVLTQYPNTMLSWRAFKRAYPDAQVFLYPFDRKLDEIILAIFEEPLKRQFSEAHGPMFPTLALADQRLSNKAQVWGVDVGGEQAAFTREFLIANPEFTFDLGGKSLVITYDTALATAKLFDRTPEGKHLPMHNGVFWMVWAHWFPATQVFDA